MVISQKVLRVELCYSCPFKTMGFLKRVETVLIMLFEIFTWATQGPSDINAAISISETSSGSGSTNDPGWWHKHM